MVANVGGWDRGLRVLVAAALILFGVLQVLTGTAAIVGYVVAGIALVTAALRFCPVNAACKVNTAKKASEKMA